MTVFERIRRDGSLEEHTPWGSHAAAGNHSVDVTVGGFVFRMKSIIWRRSSIDHGHEHEN